MDECIFCKISKGEIPSWKIYEDDKLIAFLDIRPFAKGHVLLITKKHHRWIWDLSDEETAHLYKKAKLIAKNMMKVSGDEFVASLTSGLLVEHVHLHIIPNTNPKFDAALSETLNNSRLDLSEEEFEELQIAYSLEK